MHNYIEIISDTSKNKMNEVGLILNEEKLKIMFPHGYVPASNSIDLQKDIILLISCFEKFSRRKQSSSIRSENKKLSEGKGKTTFPFTSAIWLLRQYQQYGLYEKSKERNYRSKTGVIDWKKTIKSTTPYPVNDSYLYSDFIICKSHQIKTDITLIQEHCISRSYQVLGWLFPNLFITHIKTSPFTKSESLRILQMELASNNNDQDRLLLSHLFKLVKFDSSDKSSNMVLKELFTSNFEYMWEDIIYYSLNNVNLKNFYPKASWIINDSYYKTSSIIPDTVLLNNNIAHIVDAKYYKYGYTKSPIDLPQTADIVKQIAYEDYISKKLSFDTTNSFILPGNTDRIIFQLFGKANFIDDSNKVIYGFIGDTKSLMKNYAGLSSRNIKMEYLEFF